MQLDPHLLEDIENPIHPSDFVPSQGYTILILRLPQLRDKGLEVHSYAFVVEGERCYRYDREHAKLREMGSLSDMNLFLDERTDRLMKDIQHYHFQIEELEESLYEDRRDPLFMQRWLSYKKEVSLIHRLMFHAALSFELFINYHKRHHTFQELAYADLYEHMVRIRDLAKSAMEKLDNLYDFYRAKVDERMNRNVYYLTLLSGIFLPLTLITGFFGMNTGGLPWSDDPHGTLKVILVSALLELLFLLPIVWLNSRKIERFRPKSR